MSSILVTGASGFLGTALIPKLLEKGSKIYALSRHPPVPAENLIPLIGDILEPNLGLKEVPDDIEIVVHCAALLSFKARDKDRLYQTNYQGTIHLLEWMKKHKITRLFHISTAYLFGQNDYEVTKQMAEEAISRYPEIKTTIFRPSIIIGDSKLQGLPPLSGFYYGIMAVDHIKRLFERKTCAPSWRVKIRIRGKRAGRLNLIPVDIVVRGMIDIITQDKIGVFHLTNSLAPTLKTLEEPISEAIGADVKFLSKFKPNLLERAVALSLRELSPYLKGHELTSDIQCPHFDNAFMARSIKAFLKSFTPRS